MIMGSASATLSSLKTLLETQHGKLLLLPPRLAQLYGTLRMPSPQSRPHVFSNFVSTLDGVVSLNVPGHASGGDISGFSAQDRMVMGLLRAVADVVILGSGTVGADRRHVWTAESIFPKFANDYRRLRQSLGKGEAPLNVVVTGSGKIDLRLPVFASGKVETLIITTAAGAKHLLKQRLPDALQVRALASSKAVILARDILDEVGRVCTGKQILVEGGPRLLGDFYAEHLLDEQFLTLAPQIAGRGARDHQLSLVMGKSFALADARWGRLIDVRRGGSQLFLRYALAHSGRHVRP